MKHKIKYVFTLFITAAILFQSTVSFASYRAGDNWNMFNIAYRSSDYKWMDNLVKIDESNITDEVIPANMTVDESQVLKTNVNARILGASIETGYTQRDWFFADNSLELADGYKKMTDKLYDFPNIRLGGGWSTIDNPFAKLGEQSNRTRTPYHDDVSEYMMTLKPGTYNHWDKDNIVGPIEFIKLTQEINPNMEYIISLPWDVLKTEDLVNVVSFYLDKADESEYGALRASCGIVDPVNVLCFELGNEVYCSELGHKSYNNPRVAKIYISDMRKFLGIAKKKYPQAKFAVCLRGNYQIEPETWNSWNIWMAEGVGDLVDYATPHLYYSGYETADWLFELDEMHNAFKDAVGENCNIKFLITEHGKWSAKNDAYGNNDRKEFSTHSLSGVLAVSQFYNFMYQKDFVEGANYYCYNNSAWSLVKRIDNDWLVMGMPQMMEIYEKNLGDRSVKSWIDSDSAYTDTSSTALELSNVTFAKGDDELTVYLTNRLPYTAFDINFKFNNNYTLVEETVFTAPNIYSFVADKNTENIFETNVTEKNIPNFSQYQMPSKSMVILKLKKQS